MQTNVDVYGFDTPNPAIARVQCPVLAMYGTNEPTVGTAAELEVIRRNAVAAPRVDTAMIEGADHSYSGYERDVAAVVAEWAAALA